MSEPEVKNDTIQVRVTPSVKSAFHAMSSRYGMHPSEVLRELVEGFLEGRVKLAPPTNKESLYDVPRNQD